MDGEGFLEASPRLAGLTLLSRSNARRTIHGPPARQVGKAGPADTYAECPSEETGTFFPTGALVFFILLWIINVPLQVWNVFAVWQAANEFGKAPEGKASAQGQA